MTRNLKWAGDPGPVWRANVPDEDRTLEIRKQITGTYVLVVWKTRATIIRAEGSAIIGVYHDPAVARFAAETTPLDDESLARLNKNHSVMTGFAESREGGK